MTFLMLVKNLIRIVRLVSRLSTMGAKILTIVSNACESIIAFAEMRKPQLKEVKVENLKQSNQQKGNENGKIS